MVPPLLDLIEQRLAHLLVLVLEGIFWEGWEVFLLPLFVLLFSFVFSSLPGFTHDSLENHPLVRFHQSLVSLLQH